MYTHVQQLTLHDLAKHIIYQTSSVVCGTLNISVTKLIVHTRTAIIIVPRKVHNIITTHVSAHVGIDKLTAKP